MFGLAGLLFLVGWRNMCSMHALGFLGFDFGCVFLWFGCGLDVCGGVDSCVWWCLCFLHGFRYALDWLIVGC